MGSIETSRKSFDKKLLNLPVRYDTEAFDLLISYLFDPVVRWFFSIVKLMSSPNHLYFLVDQYFSLVVWYFFSIVQKD